MGAASVALVDVLGGPPRRLRVVVATPHAAYLADGTGEVVLAAVDPRAVRVPIAVVLSRLPAGLRCGDEARAGDGALVLGGSRHPVARWYDPSVPRLAATPAPLSRPSAHTGVLELAPLLSRIGEGQGLTPEADDVVCGALATLHALGRPDVLAEVAPQVAAGCRRTTAVSAALLRAAVRGYAVPPLTAFLRALVAGDRLRLARAERALAAVGHTSGPAMGAGARRVWQLHEGMAA